jgi:hypothetical protein
MISKNKYRKSLMNANKITKTRPYIEKVNAVRLQKGNDCNLSELFRAS